MTYLVRATTATLNWTTTEEVNSSHFIVQKSTDGINFTNVGIVNAAGDRAVSMQYSLIDPNLTIGTTYYRLEQHDLDGKIAYSETRSVSREGIRGVNIIPNPNDGSFQVMFEGSGKKSAKLILFNSLNQEVYVAENVTSSSGINIHHLSSGIYYLHVVSENEIIVKKLVKE